MEITTFESTDACVFPTVSFPEFQSLPDGNQSFWLGSFTRAGFFHRGPSRWAVVLMRHLPFSGTHHGSSASQPTQDLFPGLSIHIGKQRCLFSPPVLISSLLSLVLELVSRLSNCIFVSPSSCFHHLPPTPTFLSCCCIARWHIDTS